QLLDRCNALRALEPRGPQADLEIVPGPRIDVGAQRPAPVVVGMEHRLAGHLIAQAAAPAPDAQSIIAPPSGLELPAREGGPELHDRVLRACAVGFEREAAAARPVLLDRTVGIDAGEVVGPVIVG